jgi:hypothetical protein
MLPALVRIWHSVVLFQTLAICSRSRECVATISTATPCSVTDHNSATSYQQYRVVASCRRQSATMSNSTSLFQVYLRLRPPINAAPKEHNAPWLVVEPPAVRGKQEVQSAEETTPNATHITLQPPNESRKRAIERFGFTKVFMEDASQLAVFDEIKVADKVNSLLNTGRDALIATLGVTGSGKVS